MKFLEKLTNLVKKYNEKKISIIIGDPVDHSLSPLMHNMAYQNLFIDNQFIYDKINVKNNELDEFITDLKEINREKKVFIGLTCTMPHKENIIKYLDDIKYEAKIIKAVNTVLINDNKYIGYNTDWYGIERPFIERNINLNNKKVAIIGAGGASRSAIYTFKKNNCKITIFNRTLEKAKNLSEEFKCFYSDLNDNDRIKDNDIIINTTNIGMGELIDKSPIDINLINKNHIIFDCIYKPKETKMIKKAIEEFSIVIYGWEMLLYQGVKQFEIYTNMLPNIEIMKNVLL